MGACLSLPGADKKKLSGKASPVQPSGEHSIQAASGGVKEGEVVLQDRSTAASSRRTTGGSANGSLHKSPSGKESSPGETTPNYQRPTSASVSRTNSTKGAATSRSNSRTNSFKHGNSSPQSARTTSARKLASETSSKKLGSSSGSPSKPVVEGKALRMAGVVTPPQKSPVSTDEPLVEVSPIPMAPLTGGVFV